MRLSLSVLKILKRDVFITILSILTSVVLARNLGPLILGIYSILMLVQSYIETFGRTKTEFSSTYYIGREKFSPAVIFKNLTFINIFSSLIIVLLCFLNFNNIYEIFFSKAELNYRLELSLLLITIPFQFFYLAILNINIAFENINIFNSMKSIYSFLFFVLNLFNLYLLDLGLRSVLISNLISLISALFIGYLGIPKNIRNSGYFNWKISLEIFRYGMQFYLSSLLSELLQNMNKLIASSILTPQFIGFLIQGDRFCSFLEKISSPIHTILMPRISKSDKKNAVELVMTMFRITSILLLLISFLIIILIKPLILLFYGEQFSNIYIAVYLLIPGYYCLSLSLLIKTFYSGIGKDIVYAYIQVIPLVFQLILSFFLISKFGFYGAAIAFSSTMIILLTIFVIYFLYDFKQNFYNLLVQKDDILILKKFLNKNFIEQI